MASEKKPKKEKEIVLEFETQAKDIRQQLNEQLKCLDQRLETHLAMLGELQDFYKKRADVEIEYSKNLDRLVKGIMTKHKQEKQKRDTWAGFSTYTCWQTALACTKRESRDHATMADIYSTHMSNRFADLMEDMQRIYKKGREIGFDSHEELLKVLSELQSAMKTYHVYHGESKQAESKFTAANNQKQKVEQQASKGTIGRNFKNMEKQVEKKRVKYTENKQKALKARNEYILALDATNAAIKKYYVEDIGDLVDCIDYGYHNTLARAMKVHVSTEENLIKCHQGCVDHMNNSIQHLDQRGDKQIFLELHNHTFSLPKKFEFQPHKGDVICQVSAQAPVQEDLIDRYRLLSKRLDSLKVDTDETWKTIETAEKSLMKMIDQKDYDMTAMFADENKPPKSPQEHQKKRSDRTETEAFYLSKFKEYLLGNNKFARLSAKNNSIRKALGDLSGKGGTARPPSLPPRSKKRRVGKAPIVGQPKLFGGSIEEYVEATSQEIPLVVTSCIRLINLYGMHHQGVFRIPGSAHDINEIKNQFEKGEDPLVEMTDGNDINSIAGVLKLYFRELREPLFPTQLFDELMGASKLENVEDCIARVKELITPLPRTIIVVMRYLFAFLNHLSEYSDENLMDPYNLAICFGPTLLPIPRDRDQVQFQGNVNELTKNIIIHHESIFPYDEGIKYEKCIVDETDREDDGDNLSEEEDTVASEDETDFQEAKAQYDWTGRTQRELSFKKGDTLFLYKRVSNDWWEGACQDKEGLIPDKYIQVKHRDDDEKSLTDRSSDVDEKDKRKSTESLPAKPFGPHGGLLPGSIDKSVSQPNIAMNAKQATDKNKVGSASSSGSSSISSDLSREHSDSTPSIASTLSASLVSVESNKTLEDNTSHHSVELCDDSTADDINQEIDRSLAEIESGLQSLELQHQSGDKETTEKEHRTGNPRDTPDLVLDLPRGPRGKEPLSNKSSLGSDKESPTMSTAEVFANNNTSTIKKGSSLPRSGSPLTTFTEMEGSNFQRSYSSNGRMVGRARREKILEETQKQIKMSEGEPQHELQIGHSTFLKPRHGAPDNSSIQDVKRIAIIPDHAQTSIIGTQPLARGGSEKPKPPLKIKPPLAKKPEKSPEILKRLREEAQNASSAVYGDKP